VYHDHCTVDVQRRVSPWVDLSVYLSRDTVDKVLMPELRVSGVKANDSSISIFFLDARASPLFALQPPGPLSVTGPDKHELQVKTAFVSSIGIAKVQKIVVQIASVVVQERRRLDYVL